MSESTVEALERIAKRYHEGEAYWAAVDGDTMCYIAEEALPRARREAEAIEAARAYQLRIGLGLHPSPARLFRALDNLEEETP